MSSKENASMIVGMSMDLETCQIFGQVSHNLLFWKKKFQPFWLKGILFKRCVAHAHDKLAFLLLTLSQDTVRENDSQVHFRWYGRGWTQMDVPSGWIQVLRGPRPKAERWPNAKPPMEGGRRFSHNHLASGRSEGRMRRGGLSVWKPRLQP